MVGGKRAHWKIAAACISTLFLSGCLFWNHVVVPPKPIPGGGPDPGNVSYEHDVQIGWKYPEIQILDSLKVRYPAPVTLVETNQSSELSIQLQLFIEKQHHEAYADEYLRQILAQSTLNSSDAQFIVPPPSHPCHESYDPEGDLTALSGICDQPLFILIPSTHPLPIWVQPGGDFTASNLDIPGLELSAPDGAHAEIAELTGDLRVSGGGPKATLLIDDVGNVDLELDSIRRAELHQIHGHLHIFLAHPDPSNPDAVTLDGKPITQFPYDSP